MCNETVRFSLQVLSHTVIPSPYIIKSTRSLGRKVLILNVRLTRFCFNAFELFFSLARLGVIDTRAISLISSRGVYYVRINYTNACNLQCLETIDYSTLLYGSKTWRRVRFNVPRDTRAIMRRFTARHIYCCVNTTAV